MNPPPLAYVYLGQPITVAELSRRSGIPRHTLYRRFISGLRDAALVAPLPKRKQIDPARLKEVAVLGLRCRAMSKLLGLEKSNVRKQLKRHGLYRTWQLARYRKCSTTGNTPRPKTEVSTATAS